MPLAMVTAVQPRVGQSIWLKKVVVIILYSSTRLSNRLARYENRKGRNASCETLCMFLCFV